MKTDLSPVCPAALMLIGFAVCASADESWQVASRDDDPDTGFVLYSLEDSDASSMRYRLETSFETDPQEAADIIVRVMTSPRFIPDDQRRKVLEQNENSTLLYTQIDLPLMVSDRDLVLRVTRSGDDATGVRRVMWHSVRNHPTAPEPAGGTVRMKHAEGSWVLAPDGAHRCRATYTNFTDVGGSLPSWLIEPMMRNQMTGDVQRIRDLLAESETSVSAPPPGESPNLP